MANGYAKNQDYCFSCMRKLSPGTTKCPKCGCHRGVVDAPAYALRPGAYLADGKYLVGNMLGHSGVGFTYIGMYMALNKKVAIKECFPRSLANRDIKNPVVIWRSSEEGRNCCERFIKEARRMARIDEIGGVAKVLDIFYQNNTAYIVMAFIEGETLKAKVKREGVMSAPRCVEFLSIAIETLEQVHKHGLIHGDISPDNILIDPKGKPWILDMGVAKDLHLGDKIYVSQAIEKKGFSPLEQSIGNNIGPWTDVYAMCATIYYCLTGQIIHEAKQRLYMEMHPPQSQDSLLYALSIEPSFQKIIPRALAKVLERGLEIHFDYRIPNMTLLRRGLHAACQQFNYLGNAACYYSVSGLSIFIEYPSDLDHDGMIKELLQRYLEAMISLQDSWREDINCVSASWTNNSSMENTLHDLLILDAMLTEMVTKYPTISFAFRCGYSGEPARWRLGIHDVGGSLSIFYKNGKTGVEEIGYS